MNTAFRYTTTVSCLTVRAQWSKHVLVWLIKTRVFVMTYTPVGYARKTENETRFDRETFDLLVQTTGQPTWQVWTNSASTHTCQWSFFFTDEMNALLQVPWKTVATLRRLSQSNNPTLITNQNSVKVSLFVCSFGFWLTHCL